MIFYNRPAPQTKCSSSAKRTPQVYPACPVKFEDYLTGVKCLSLFHWGGTESALRSSNGTEGALLFQRPVDVLP